VRSSKEWKFLHSTYASVFFRKIYHLRVHGKIAMKLAAGLETVVSKFM